MSEISAIRVDDQDFLVTSLIERCPKKMMIRELFKNAVEAAEQLGGEGRVEFGVTEEFFETPKLTIWNNGPGMDESELRQMTNLAASIRKVKGLDANFGMGAKVASLPSNRQGLVYRSCKNGRVHETILCERDGAFGRLRRQGSDGTDLGDVIDVTEQIDQACIRDISEDWTEVTLLGNRDKQNTAVDPYDGDPAVKKFWLANALYHRFYRLPEVKVILDEGTQARDGRRTFETIPARISKGAFSQFEMVSLPSGVNIHYIYDGPFNETSHNKSISGAIASAVSTCAVVYKGEMYSVAMGRDWTIQAPSFGISFGAKHISVHIELPDDFKVRPEAYRQYINHLDGDQSQVNASDFAVLVLENRPDWLVALIRSLAPNTGNSDEEIRNSLQELLNRYRIKMPSPAVSAVGPVDVDPGTGGGSATAPRQNGGGGGTKTDDSRRKSTDLSVVQSGAQMARMAQNMQRAPRA
ncbi:ATP-binding protein [Brevundimonas albigilva]|uniref:ATP-binding protein n=1 Tax=Brevundimonas albigilva TaxID=1312364 RepID=UPI00201B8938|nr:ATP-binding protein [Brevundimonas albigilva]UQV17573.1 ATP-binding protein [Brevundimonas albigilva]